MFPEHGIYAVSDFSAVKKHGKIRIIRLDVAVVMIYPDTRTALKILIICFNYLFSLFNAPVNIWL